MTPINPLNIRGFQVYKGFLDRAAQESLVADIRGIARSAPLFAPLTPSGKQMSVQMTSAGHLGWVTDRKGYRYQKGHPSGRDWPAIPENILGIWRRLGSAVRDPESCLVNFYGEDARMGMHQDKDEGDFRWPVVSISLGDDALFRMGNSTKGGKTESVWLASGDVVVMGGEARLSFHGIDRIRFGSSSLLPKSGRINLTLRVVDQGESPQQPSSP